MSDKQPLPTGSQLTALDPVFREHPHQYLDRLRAEDPVHHDVEFGRLDLFAIVKRIVDAKAQFRSLAEPWADSGSCTGRLMLAVLGGLADVERDLIRTRTA